MRVVTVLRWAGTSPATTSSRATARRSAPAGRSATCLAAAPPTASASASSRGSFATARRRGVPLDGLAAAFTVRYDDDEPGSPWSFVVYVDERGTEEQRDALAAILTGRFGGEGVLKLPWVSKPSELVDVRPAAIDLRFADGDYELRVGSKIELAASRSGRDGRARQLRHPRPPHRRHRALRRPARRRRRPVPVGARRQLRLRQHVLLFRLMPSSTVCLSFDFDALSRFERMADVAQRLESG